MLALDRGVVCVETDTTARLRPRANKMTSLEEPGGTTIFLRDNGEATIEFSLNQESWTELVFPVTVENTDSSLGLLRLVFTTNCVFSTVDHVFVCASGSLQFGSEALLDSGSRPVINIVPNEYPGLIQNGTDEVVGFDNIVVCNLVVIALGESVTADQGGWIGQVAFGHGAANNYIVNCSTNGAIGAAGGGIVGAGCALNGGNVRLLNCTSQGVIGTEGGGIVGTGAGVQGGFVRCEGCASLGEILAQAGGVYGSEAGLSGGNVQAENCYSLGAIGEDAGGIFGDQAVNETGTNGAFGCYSLGAIAADGGGIVGAGAGTIEGSDPVLLNNCFSVGSITTEGTGLAGSGSNVTLVNTYAADGSWSTSEANENLTGVPVAPATVGFTWALINEEQPFLNRNILCSAYTLQTVVLDVTNGVVDNAEPQSLASATVLAGQSTSESVQGANFVLVGGDTDPSITIDADTGMLSTTAETPAQTYSPLWILYERDDNGFYQFVLYGLTVAPPPAPEPPSQPSDVNWSLVAVAIGAPLLGAAVLVLSVVAALRK